MTKSELIQRLAKRYPYLYQRDVERLVNTVLESVSQTLVEGGRVELRGFGAFSVRKREARKARNPKNGAEVYIGERYTIYFRTGKELRERINGQPSTSASSSPVVTPLFPGSTTGGAGGQGGGFQ